MQMINETSRGYLSSTARDTLASLARSLADDVAETAMRLFATDLQVEAFNMQRLLAVRLCRLHSTLIEDMQTKNYIHVCCVHYFHYAYLVKQLAVRIFVCFIVIQKPGTMYVFDAVDSGDKKRLTRKEGVTAGEKISLKIGCPVMLLRNMSAALVNGR